MATETVAPAPVQTPERALPDNVVLPRPSARERWTIGLITAAFGLLLIVWAVLTPMFQAPDEAAHYDAAVQIAVGNGWQPPGKADLLASTFAQQNPPAGQPPAVRATQGELQAQNPGHHDFVNQMTQHPPTYYALDAAVLHAVHFEGRRWDHDVMILRIFDSLMVTPIPLFVWMSVRRLLKSPKIAVVAAMTVFAVPQLAQIGSSVTNDAPVLLLGAVISWLGVRVMTGDHRWRTVIWLGVALGAILSMKGTGFPAIFFVAVAVLLGGLGQMSWPTRILRTVVTGVIAAALGSWYWVHNVIAYHSVQPSAAPLKTMHWPKGQSANFGYFFNTEWDRISSSFWGQFGPLLYPMTPILTDTLTVVAIGVIVCYGFRRHWSLAPMITMALMPVFAAVFLLDNNWNSYDRTEVVSGAQGRYFFVAIVPLIAMSAIAWNLLLHTTESRRRFARIVAICAPIVGLYGLSVAYRGFYEKFHLAIDRKGIALMLNSTAIGKYPTALLFAVAAVVGLAAIVAVWQLGSRRVDRLPRLPVDAIDPSDGAAIDTAEPAARIS